jgi:DNA replication initiation complex subunit (GINS family)
MMDFSLEELVRIYKEEKISRDLVEIPDDLYQMVAKHVSQLTYELKHADLLRRELLQEELRNVVFMVQEIHFTRVSKTLRATTQGRPPAPLIERERYAFSEIRQILEKLQAELVRPAISGKVEVSAPLNITNVLLLILTDIQEKIIGIDMRSYGPFTKGELVNLPAPNADMMARHGLARKITVKV